MSLFSSLLQSSSTTMVVDPVVGNDSINSTIARSEGNSSNNNNNSAARITTTSTNKYSRNVHLPTVVQLFTQPCRPFPLIIDTAAQQLQQQQPVPSYAAIHYSAIQCLTEVSTVNAQQQQMGGGAATTTTTTTTMGLRGGNDNMMTIQQRRKTASMETLIPDLGVWNMKVDTNSVGDRLLDALMPLVHCNTYCMVVDLSIPNLVEASITKMQQAMIRYLIQRSNNTTMVDNESNLATQTTSLYDLRSVQFGLGDHDESSLAQLGKGSAEESDRTIIIALQICVRQNILTASSIGVTEDYKDLQIQKMLLYHLRKYAAALNATLIFVADDITTTNTTLPDDATNNQVSSQQPTFTTAQLPIVWKALAQGKKIWKYTTMEAFLDDATMGQEESIQESKTNGEEGESPEVSGTLQIYSLVYGPDNHNSELIESVLQRSANYPGHWDVTTDSIWKILPAHREESSSTSTSHKSPIMAGDASWLTELYDSVKNTDGAALQTPVKSSVDKDNNGNMKTPNDQAVSSFFEGLLS